MVLREQEEDEDDEEEEDDDEEEEGDDDDEEDEEEEAIRRAPGAQPKAIDEYRFIKGKMRHQMLKVSIGGYLVTKRRLVQLLEREEILVATRHQVTELEKDLGNARASRVIPLGPLGEAGYNCGFSGYRTGGDASIPECALCTFVQWVARQGH